MRRDKLCIDCAHYFTPPERCIRPLTSETSPVDGEFTRRLIADPEVERRNGATFWTRRQRCGPAGLFFKPLQKNKK